MKFKTEKELFEEMYPGYGSYEDFINLDIPNGMDRYMNRTQAIEALNQLFKSQYNQ